MYISRGGGDSGGGDLGAACNRRDDDISFLGGELAFANTDTAAAAVV